MAITKKSRTETHNIKKGEKTIGYHQIKIRETHEKRNNKNTELPENNR